MTLVFWTTSNFTSPLLLLILTQNRCVPLCNALHNYKPTKRGNVDMVSTGFGGYPQK